MVLKLIQSLSNLEIQYYLPLARRIHIRETSLYYYQWNKIEVNCYVSILISLQYLQDAMVLG